MESIDLGFNSHGILTARLPFSVANYPTAESLNSHYRTLLNRTAGIPGVNSVGASTSLPLSDIRESRPVAIGAGETGSALVAHVSPEYLATLGIPLLQGRAFRDSDDNRNSPVAIVDAGFAHSRFGDIDPIGASVTIGELPGQRSSIVGVVADVRQFGPRRAFEPTVYLPLLQSPRWSTFVAIRTGSSSPPGLSNALRKAVAAVDKNQLVTSIRSMTQRLDARTRRPRFSLWLFGAFGSLALAMGMVGVYSVTSFATRRRTKAIGIQLALGAPQSSVYLPVFARGIRPVGIGLYGGILVAIGFGHLLESQLLGIRPIDPVAAAGGVLALLLVSVLGSYVPARRASRIDPRAAIWLA